MGSIVNTLTVVISKEVCKQSRVLLEFMSKNYSPFMMWLKIFASKNITEEL